MDLEPLIVAAVRAGKDYHVATGTYPPFYLRGAVAPKPVTITADPGVVLSFVAQSAENLTFSGVELVVDPKQGAAANFQGGKSLTLDGCNIHGKAVGDGLGVKAIGVHGLTISNSEFHNLQGGTAIKQCDTVLIETSRFHDIQVDGNQLSATSNVTITGNDFRDWQKQPLDHSDAIQFVGVGPTAPVSNITVRGNVIVRGKGAPPGIQGIFIGDEGGQTYTNVTVDGNAVVGGDYNSITLAGVQSGVLSNNLVVEYADHEAYVMVYPTCGPVVLTGNTAPKFNLPKGAAPLDPSNVVIAAAPVGDTAVLAAWQKPAAPVPAEPSAADWKARALAAETIVGIVRKAVA